MHNSILNLMAGWHFSIGGKDQIDNRAGREKKNTLILFNPLDGGVKRHMQHTHTNTQRLNSRHQEQTMQNSEFYQEFFFFIYFKYKIVILFFYFVVTGFCADYFVLPTVVDDTWWWREQIPASAHVPLVDSPFGQACVRFNSTHVIWRISEKIFTCRHVHWAVGSSASLCICSRRIHAERFNFIFIS